MSDQPDMRAAMTPARADTLSGRFFWAGVAVLTIATALNLLGFKMFFMPLAAVWVLLLSRVTYWNGWRSGYKAAREIYLHKDAGDFGAAFRGRDE